LVAQAAALTVFVLAGNTMLRPLVNAINRIPLDEKASEATYYFKLAVAPEALTCGTAWSRNLKRPTIARTWPSPS
jgi:putative Mg2+ transporter-C (MgtC) family protein